MAGITITGNSITLNLAINASVDAVKTLDADFTIVIEEGAKAELAGNLFYIDTPGGYQLLIDDQATDGYVTIGWNEEENIFPAGTYLMGCVYASGKVIILKIDNPIISE